MGSELDDIFAICIDQTLSHGGRTLFILEKKRDGKQIFLNIISFIDII